jgi:uncharacterized protein (TIGR02118 family)
LHDAVHYWHRAVIAHATPEEKMAKLVALYKTPKDPAAFDKYYFSKHVPQAKKIPGLKGYDVSDGTAYGPEGVSPYHLVATLHFDTLADIQSALVSPEGQATANDLANFADGGVELIFFDTREV